MLFLSITYSPGPGTRLSMLSYFYISLIPCGIAATGSRLKMNFLG